MMRNYREYSKVPLGCSDIAQLTVVVFDGEEYLFRTGIRFGQDGRYKAYIVDEKCEIPAHYKITDEYLSGGYSWVWIYDDNRKTFSAEFCHYMKIYRAGDFGCIIQIY